MTMLPDVDEQSWRGYEADDLNRKLTGRIDSMGFLHDADQRIASLSPTSSDSLTNPLGTGNAGPPPSSVAAPVDSGPPAPADTTINPITSSGAAPLTFDAAPPAPPPPKPPPTAAAPSASAGVDPIASALSTVHRMGGDVQAFARNFRPGGDIIGSTLTAAMRSGIQDLQGFADQWNYQPPAPAAPGSLPSGAAGPTRASANPSSSEVRDYIARAAQQRGIDPNIALRVAQSEGGFEAARRGTFDTGSSWWPFQLHYGGKGYEQLGSVAGMGNDFTARTGIQPGDPSGWQAATDYALDRAKESGWGGWYGAKAQGITGFDGIDRGAPGVISDASRLGRTASQGASGWLNLAKEQLGKPYIWGSQGGRSDFSADAAGFDCSGFVSYIYKNGLGIDLPAFTGTAYQATKPISGAQAQPGDVVLYNMDNPDPHAQHIAIYLGEGQVIQAGGGKDKNVNIAPIGQAGSYEFRRADGAETVLGNQVATQQVGNASQAAVDDGKYDPLSWLDQTRQTLANSFDELGRQSRSALQAAQDRLSSLGVSSTPTPSDSLTNPKLKPAATAEPSPWERAANAVGDAAGLLGNTLAPTRNIPQPVRDAISEGAALTMDLTGGPSERFRSGGALAGPIVGGLREEAGVRQEVRDFEAATGLSYPAFERETARQAVEIREGLRSDFDPGIQRARQTWNALGGMGEKAFEAYGRAPESAQLEPEIAGAATQAILSTALLPGSVGRTPVGIARALGAAAIDPGGVPFVAGSEALEAGGRALRGAPEVAEALYGPVSRAEDLARYTARQAEMAPERAADVARMVERQPQSLGDRALGLIGSLGEGARANVVEEAGEEVPVSRVPQLEQNITGAVQDTVKRALGGTASAEDLADAQRTIDELRGTSALNAFPTLQTPEGLTAVRRQLRALADAGAEQRHWYDESSREIMRAVQGNKEDGEKIAQLVAIYSNNTPVSENMNNAMTAWTQFKAGRPIDAPTLGGNNKRAHDLLYGGKDWKGAKTNNFYRNLMKNIDPERYTQMGLETGQTGVTIDVWMMRALNSLMKSPSAKTGQYEFAAREVAKIAAERGWTPEQAQAAIWVATKAGWENAKRKVPMDLSRAGTFHYGTALQQRMARTNLGAASSEGDTLAREFGLLGADGQISLPQARQTREDMAVFGPLGEHQGSVDYAARRAMDAYIATRGRDERLPEVYWIREFAPKTLDNANGMVVDAGRALEPAELQQLQANLDGLIGEGGSWVVPTDNGAWIVNRSGAPNKAFHNASDRAVEALDSVDAVTTQPSRFDGERFTNDWSLNPNGEGYADPIRRAGPRPGAEGDIGPGRSPGSAGLDAGRTRDFGDQPLGDIIAPRPGGGPGDLSAGLGFVGTERTGSLPRGAAQGALAGGYAAAQDEDASPAEVALGVLGGSALGAGRSGLGRVLGGGQSAHLANIAGDLGRAVDSSGKLIGRPSEVDDDIRKLIIPGREAPPELSQIYGPRGQLLETIGTDESGRAAVSVTREGAEHLPEAVIDTKAMPNLANLAEEGQIQQTIARNAITDPALVAKYTRGTQKWDELIETVSKGLGLTADQFRKTKAGRAFNEAEMLTLRAAMVSEMDKLDDAMQVLAEKGGRATDEERLNARLALLDAQQLQAVATGAASTAGRTLNQQKIRVTREMAQRITTANEVKVAKAAADKAQAALDRATERANQAAAKATTQAEKKAASEAQKALDKAQRDAEKAAASARKRLENAEARDTRRQAWEAKRAKQALEMLGGEKITDEIVEAYLKIKKGDDPRALGHYLRALQKPSWWDRANILRYGSMLSATTTHTVQAASNAASLGLRPVAHALGVPMDILTQAARGGERTRYMAELGETLPGYGEGARAAIPDAIEMLRTGINHSTVADDLKHLSRGFGAAKSPAARAGFGATVGALTGAATAPDDADLSERARRALYGGLGGATAGALARGRRAGAAIDFAAEAPLRLMAASDIMFRGAARGAATRELALRQAMNEGLRGAEAQARALEIRQDFVGSFPDLADQAEKMAARSVYQEQRESQRFVPKTGIVGKVASIPIPFSRTPINIAAQAAGMTPLGIVGVIEAAARGDRGEAIDRASRALIGTAALYASYEAGKRGFLTAGYPEDQYQRNALPQGWKPWSVRVPGENGDTYVPYASLGAAGMAMAIGAAISASERRGDEVNAETLAKGALSMGRYFTDQLALTGLNNMLNAVQQPDRYGEAFIESLASQPTPYGGLQRQILAAEGKPLRDPENVGEAFLAGLEPFADTVRPRLDQLGREVQPGATGLGAFAPLRYSYSNDPEAELLEKMRRYKVNLADAAKESGGVPFTLDEQRANQAAMLPYIHELVARMESREGFADWPEERKQDAYRAVVEAARSRVAGERLRGIGRDEALRRYRENELKKGPSGTGAVP